MSSANRHRQTYLARINRVLDHIGAHLTDPLDLATLASVAHFSPWHFHRLFQAMTGETLADCVRRLRLEAAAHRLVRRPADAVLTIALEVGFGSAEVFSRAFKAHFGVTATAWRRGAWRVHSDLRSDQLSKIRQAQRNLAQDLAAWPQHHADTPPAGRKTHEETAPMQVELKTLPAMRLAYMRWTGPYGHPGITRTWERFAAWCGTHGVGTPRSQTYGIAQDDPEITPADKCRYDCCVAVDGQFRPSGELGVQDFAGGRFACARFTGTGADIQDAWMNLYGKWLPASGLQGDDGPCVEIYDADFAVDPLTGRFSCWLCVPVRPL